ncbi:MAG: SRPBCC family protein, partial [Cyanobacteria bacterium J06639_14]
IGPQLAPHRFDQAKVIVRDHYTVNANWKTILENNRECYHCQVAHPEFMVANYDAGLPGDDRPINRHFQALKAAANQRWEAMGLQACNADYLDGSWCRAARFPLRDGCVTESLHGRMTAPLMGDLPSEDVGSLRIIGLPNFWGHANADYGMTTQVIPISPSETEVIVAFLVREDAVAGVDYSPEDVAAVWRITSEQDWQICESNYAGIRSSIYQPGHLSLAMEGLLAEFIDWYLQCMKENVNVNENVNFEGFLASG